MINRLSNSPLANQMIKEKEYTPREQETQTPQQQNPQLIQSKENIEKVVASINDFLKPANSHLKFEFHEDLKEYYVTIVDDSTKEVIKEIPSKKLLDMYSAMKEYLGLLVDKKI
ncbi:MULTISPECIES: flagellar protein FlaG [Bacillaceae]|uniref:flagellar protein FlaG n=1 Tax=Bacillaceae TaxID=186817 RepID=UPI0021557EB5|nr:flagellar protein FlaG [Bacillus infantis]MCR6612758.1 flagellar protein FlaG [Bacillus infantis]MDW2876655.1 flagellar protein FlaG [Bacillus infantis]